jgi:branched-chain amino acid transport system permease protein
VIGYGLQKFLIGRVLDMGLNQPVLVTFALSIIIQNLLLIVFTSDARTLATGYWLSSVGVDGLTLPLRYTLGFILAIATFLALYFFFQKTYVGKAMRAVPIDIEAAKIMGIRPDKIYNFAMGIALLVTGLAGVLLGMLFTFYPDSGPTYLLLAFGVVVLGGLGSLKGTVVGGLIIGETLILAGYFLGSYYQLMACYIVILAILVFRPQGIFRGVRI